MFCVHTRAFSRLSVPVLPYPEGLTDAAGLRCVRVTVGMSQLRPPL